MRKIISFILLVAIIINLIPRTATVELDNSVEVIRYSPGTTAILVEGVISDESYDKFHSFMQEAVNRKDNNIIIILNSQGGDVAAGADFIDDMVAFGLSGGNLTTVVPDDAICMSMCTVIFAGAENRLIGKKSSWLFHSPRTNKTDSEPGILKRTVIDYSIERAREYSMLVIANADPDFAEIIRPVIYSDDPDKSMTFTGEEILEVSETFGRGY